MQVRGDMSALGDSFILFFFVLTLEASFVFLMYFPIDEQSKIW